MNVASAHSLDRRRARARRRLRRALPAGRVGGLRPRRLRPPAGARGRPGEAHRLGGAQLAARDPRPAELCPKRAHVRADEWLLDVLFRARVADGQPIFVINDPDVLGLIGLGRPRRIGISLSRTLSPKLGRSRGKARRRMPIDAKKRTRFQSAIVNLYERHHALLPAENSIQIRAGRHRASPPRSRPRRDREDGAGSAGADASWPSSAPLPPAPGESPDKWRSVGEALQARGGSAIPRSMPARAPRRGLTRADWPTSTRAVADAAARRRRPASPRRAEGARRVPLQPRRAVLPRHGDLRARAARPLRLAGSGSRAVLQPTAFALLLVGALVHTAGLVARILLQGRPPVTNLYSIGGVRRLGRGGARPRPRADLPPRLRHRGRRRRRLHHADHRAPPRRRRRHHGDDARGARLQLLARAPTW